MKRFACGILLGCLGLVGGLGAIYGALAFFMPASMPPPPISRLAAMDEKLRFLREHPEFDPVLIAVGSSITWRQVAGAPFEKAAGGSGHFLNGATVKLQIHQTRDLVDFYLANYSNISNVLLMVGLPDFEDCSSEPARLFDHDTAKAYAFDRWPSAYFYLRYFAPKRFASTAMTLAGRRTPFTGDLFLDDYGSGPLDVPEKMKRGLRYSEIQTDPACIDKLVEMSRSLTARGVQMTLVFPPVHPEYRLAYPAAMPTLCRIAKDVAVATKEDSIRILLMPSDPSYTESDFFDAFHLQYPAVQRFSTRVAQEMLSSGEMQNIRATGVASGLMKVQGLNRNCPLA